MTDIHIDNEKVAQKLQCKPQTESTNVKMTPTHTHIYKSNAKQSVLTLHMTVEKSEI